MFELVYLHPFTNNRLKLNDEQKVSYSSAGVFIRITTASTMLIPWHRVLSITGPKDSMKLFAENTAFWG